MTKAQMSMLKVNLRAIFQFFGNGGTRESRTGYFLHRQLNKHGYETVCDYSLAPWSFTNA